MAFSWRYLRLFPYINDNDRREDGNMADFDRERALDIIKNGTEAEQQRLIDEIAKQLDTKRYGLVWEHGGNGEGSVFDTEDVCQGL